jgi:cellulose biosynthesis protein BcsQ
LAALETAISSFDRSTDFLVIDTPSNDTYLMRLAHLMADTVLTPLPDSFVDFGMLASIDPITHEVTGTGQRRLNVGRSGGRIVAGFEAFELGENTVGFEIASPRK